jgi:hypothetical protein
VVKCFRQLFAGASKFPGRIHPSAWPPPLAKEQLPFSGDFDLKPTTGDLCATLDFTLQSVLEAPGHGFRSSAPPFYSVSNKNAVMQNTVGGDELHF